jgi:hypothetical protein
MNTSVTSVTLAYLEALAIASMLRMTKVQEYVPGILWNAGLFRRYWVRDGQYWKWCEPGQDFTPPAYALTASINLKQTWGSVVGVLID